MRERLIVNFLKQLIMFGVEMVKENIRSQVLRTYARLEQQGKVKQPKSLHYLLQLYRTNKEDVPQMLSVFVEQEKTRSRKRIEKQMLEEAPTQIDDYLLNDSSLVQEEDSYLLNIRNKPLTRAQLHLEKVMKDIEKIKTVKNEAKDKRTLEEELRRVKDEQQKVQAKKKVERIQLEHGVLPAKKVAGVTRGLSVDHNSRTLHHESDAHNTAPMDKDGRPIEIKIIKA